MVNTFLPYEDFVKSARVLDWKRLGKQRVEAWQILRALFGETKGWRNHPATQLWSGYEKLLCEYGIAICDEWIRRGYHDTMREKFIAVHSTLPDCDKPSWLGEIKFHESHKSNLKRKNPDVYSFRINDNLPYQWYDPDTKSYFTINKGKRIYETQQEVGETN